MKKGYCEICNTQEILNKHHIQSSSKNGTNHPSNITYICANCHGKVHFGEIIIEGVFMTTLGRKLIWRLPTQETITGYAPEVFTFK
jgi:uncharacterized protein YlaI